MHRLCKQDQLSTRGAGQSCLYELFLDLQALLFVRRITMLLLIVLLLASSVFASYNVSLDDNDPSIVYTGPWYISGDSPLAEGLLYGGGIHATNELGASANLVFTGMFCNIAQLNWSQKWRAKAWLFTITATSISITA
jgi:hypothetical protein